MSVIYNAKILLKTGSGFPGVVLDLGEAGYDISSNKLWLGNGIGNAPTGITMDSSFNFLWDIVSGLESSSGNYATQIYVDGSLNNIRSTYIPDVSFGLESFYFDTSGYIQTSGAGAIGAGIVGKWRFNNTLSDTDPGSGFFQLNNADPSLATYIYINNNTLGSKDLSNILLDFKTGDNIYLQKLPLVSEYGIFTLTGEPINAISYVKLPVISTGVHSGSFTNNADFGTIFLYTGRDQFATTNYVDGSLSLRDTSIAWLNDNKVNNASLGLYATNASVGLALLPYATNASIGLANFLKSVDISSFATNASVGLALGPYATNASVGLAISPFATNSSVGLALLPYATNASVGIALGSYATNASIGLAGFAKNASLGLYATNASIGLAGFAKNASLGLYATNASVGLALLPYATNASVGLALSKYVPNASLGLDFYWQSGLLEVSVGSILTPGKNLTYDASGNIALSNSINLTADASIQGVLFIDQHEKFKNYTLSNASTGDLWWQSPRLLFRDGSANRDILQGSLKGISYPASPSEGDMFYRNDVGLLFVYDGSRGKYLSAGRSTLNGGRTTAVAGSTVYVRVGDATQSSTAGYRMIRNGTITGFSVVNNNTLTASRDVQIRINDVSALTRTIVIGQSGFNFDQANVDFSAGDLLQVSALPGGTGSALNNWITLIEFATRS
jgi:hypothetical protein